MAAQRGLTAQFGAALAGMRDAFERAEFCRAAEQFDAHPDLRREPEAIVLRARIYLKQDDAPAAISLLSKLTAKSQPLRFTRDLFLAVAYARAGEYSIADRYFSSARGVMPRTDAARTMYAYWHGYRFVLARDVASAAAQLQLLQQSETKYSRLLALHLQSFIANLERRYKEQARLLMVLLEQIEPGSNQHAEIEAFATHTLAALAREIDEPAAIAVVRRHVEAAAWPSDFGVQKFQALKALGWALALRGDNFNAFRLLRQSSKAAPTDAWRVVALADRAYLAACISIEWSRQELDEAENISDYVDWRAMRGEERIALILLAELFTKIDPSRAAFYLAKYRELGSFNAPLWHYNYDERLDAIADYCGGIVHLAVGERGQGLKLLRRAFDVYDGSGYDWRAGRCALRLYEATNSTEWLTTAKRKLSAYPHSWLWAQVTALERSRIGGQALPPAQRRVFRELCAGRSATEIAGLTGRSVNTVRNHIKALFKTFGVNSQAGLLAEAARRGLI
jgi:DNA-binding CsgD family transcriptional regulator